MTINPQLKPRSSICLLLKTPLPLQPPHQHAPMTTSITINTAKTIAAVSLPTKITAAAKTAAATGAMATWVGMDDELGPVPMTII